MERLTLRMRISMSKERETIYRAHKIGKRQTEKASVFDWVSYSLYELCLYLLLLCFSVFFCMCRLVFCCIQPSEKCRTHRFVWIYLRNGKIIFTNSVFPSEKISQLAILKLICSCVILSEFHWWCVILINLIRFYWQTQFHEKRIRISVIIQ